MTVTIVAETCGSNRAHGGQMRISASHSAHETFRKISFYGKPEFFVHLIIMNGGCHNAWLFLDKQMQNRRPLAKLINTSKLCSYPRIFSQRQCTISDTRNSGLHHEPHSLWILRPKLLTCSCPRPEQNAGNERDWYVDIACWGGLEKV